MLYGWHPGRMNFATWIIDSLRNGKRINVADDHYNSPTLADNLAEMTQRIVSIDAAGVYHVAGCERISRYGFVMKIAEVFGLDRALIVPVKMENLKIWVAKRPRDSSLSLDRILREFDVSPLGLDEALKRMKLRRRGFDLGCPSDVHCVVMRYQIPVVS